MLYSQQLGGSSTLFSDSRSKAPAPTQRIDRRFFDKVFCKSETLEIIRLEWKADAAALASDGQYWRSVFGGARLVLGTIRCTPTIFLVFRVLLAGATGTVFYYQLISGGTSLSGKMDGHMILYFDTWVLIAMSIYFLLATGLTLVATMTVGGIARTTPFLVRVTEIVYSVLPPSTFTLALYTFCVEWVHFKHCAPAVAQLHGDKRAKEQIVLTCSMLLIVLLDATFNRQPYYASFHAILGAAFVYIYLGFTGIYEAAGGTDIWGHSYVYRCLDWSVPISGQRTATGKLLTCNFFLFVPLVNFLYWFLLWARRRTLAYSRAASIRESAAASLIAPQPLAPGRRFLFEYSADYRDLRLDGRHWQAQFGGSSRPTDESVGAYVCCNSCAYALTRFVFAIVTVGVGEVRLLQFWKQYPDRWWCIFLYMQNWLLLLAAIYFVLVCLLTSRATCLPGAVATGTPFFVWVVWALNGMLVPFSMCTAILYPFVNTSDDFSDSATIFDWSTVYIVFALVMIDAFINRQPYYATFHAFLGCFICWSYFVFLILYPALGGTNEKDEPYIYHQWPTPTSWSKLSQIFTIAKIFTFEILVGLPLFFVLYWCTLWSVRRARVAAKKQERMSS